jgi:hypothetical protein
MKPPPKNPAGFTGVAFPQVPDHLHEALALAAREELEFASDGIWPEDEDEYVIKLARVTRATRVIEHLEAGAWVREDIGKLAAAAVGMQEPGRWPRTLEEAYDAVDRASLTRDLILLRDALGARPSQEELDEPE